VIIWGGSEGGIWYSDMIAKRLSEDGYLCMALAYFNFEDLPLKLNRIKIEYFLNAIDYLKTHKNSISEKISIIGISRGSESALFLGTIRNDINKIVAIMPSNSMNEALPVKNNKLEPAWIYNNKDITPYNYFYWDQITNKENKIIRIENLIKNAEGIIPIEKINSKILLISAGKDKLWNSKIMAKLILRRNMRINKIKNNIEIYNYENSGHFAYGIPEIQLTQDDVNIAGGTVIDNNKSRKIIWNKLNAFLKSE